MKTRKWIMTVLLMALPILASAGNDKGNGGDACSESITRAYNILNQSLGYQGQGAFPEFKFPVIGWFMENTRIALVPRTEVDGIETDAKNYPEKKIIELNRNRWCTLEMETKVRILFHEYLGLMGLEKTNDYGISNRIEVVLNPSKYSCEIPVYSAACFKPHRNYPPSNNKCKSAFNLKALGPNLNWIAQEFNRQSSDWGGHFKTCKRVEVRVMQENSPAVLNEYIGICSEEATWANSCVRTD